MFCYHKVLIFESSSAILGVRPSETTLMAIYFQGKVRSQNLAARAGLEESRGRHKFGVGRNQGPFLRKLKISPKFVQNSEKLDFGG